MHFSGDVTFGTVVSIASFLGVMIPMFIRLGHVIDLFKQFPPHRHFGKMPPEHYIIYPRGLRPDNEDRDK